MPRTTAPTPALRLSGELEVGWLEGARVVLLLEVELVSVSSFLTCSTWPWVNFNLPSWGTIPPPCTGRLPSPVVRPLAPRPWSKADSEGMGTWAASEGYHQDPPVKPPGLRSLRTGAIAECVLASCVGREKPEAVERSGEDEKSCWWCFEMLVTARSYMLQLWRRCRATAAPPLARLCRGRAPCDELGAVTCSLPSAVEAPVRNILKRSSVSAHSAGAWLAVFRRHGRQGGCKSSLDSETGCSGDCDKGGEFWLAIRMFYRKQPGYTPKPR